MTERLTKRIITIIMEHKRLSHRKAYETLF